MSDRSTGSKIDWQVHWRQCSERTEYEFYFPSFVCLGFQGSFVNRTHLFNELNGNLQTVDHKFAQTSLVRHPNNTLPHLAPNFNQLGPVFGSCR